jgi:Putative MetA-pathway of phenol degradation
LETTLRIARQSILCRAAAATVLLAGSCFVSSAQTKVPAGDAPVPPTQVQIDNAESTSKPDDVQIPEANPSRPTLTNPAHIPPVGYLQFEQGLLQANGSPSGPDGQFSLGQAIRLSVHPRLMVQFQSQPIAVSRSAATSSDPASSQTDPGDLVVGLQGVLLKEAGRGPAIAVGYLHRVRSGSAPDLDIGSFSQSAVVLISGDLGDFHYDSNYIVSEQGEDPVRRAQFGQTLSVTHDLFSERFHDKLEITGELWHFSQPLVETTRAGAASPRSNAVGLLWALGYSARPNLVLDCGFERGLTSTSTAWQGFAGFTYLLPHRLWGRTEAGVAGPHKHVHRR